MQKEFNSTEILFYKLIYISNQTNALLFWNKNEFQRRCWMLILHFWQLHDRPKRNEKQVWEYCQTNTQWHVISTYLTRFIISFKMHMDTMNGILRIDNRFIEIPYSLRIRKIIHYMVKTKILYFIYCNITWITKKLIICFHAFIKFLVYIILRFHNQSS